MTKGSLTFPVYKPTWGDEWFNAGLEGVSEEDLEAVYEDVLSDPAVAELFYRAFRLYEKNQVGFPELIDEGRYLVIPLDAFRNLQREAREDVKDSEDDKEEDDPRYEPDVASVGGM